VPEYWVKEECDRCYGVIRIEVDLNGYCEPQRDDCPHCGLGYRCNHRGEIEQFIDNGEPRLDSTEVAS
jgi:hypothetical protein